MIWNPLYIVSIILIFVYTLTYDSIYAGTLWSLAQISRSLLPLLQTSSWFNHHISRLEQMAWRQWESLHRAETTLTLSIPTIDMKILAQCLENQVKTPSVCCREMLGENWRKYPALIRNLWTEEELTSSNRLLSLEGLETQDSLSDMIIPYYTDSSRKISSTSTGYNYLSPDASSRLSDIVHNITIGSKAKIATQYIVEKNPHLINEILPPKYSLIIHDLFGDMFQPHHLEPTGPFGIFPAWTTVPIFIAGSGCITSIQTDDCYIDPILPDENDSHPRTDLHCEPIGNIAVQLDGSKRWSLVSPQYSAYLRPTVSRHGRAFFFSMLQNSSNLEHVPHYDVITGMGDALWVPPWTWHKVDYDQRDQRSMISLAASLFHFRPYDFLTNRPLFAIIIIPNLLKELLGWKIE